MPLVLYQQDALVFMMTLFHLFNMSWEVITLYSQLKYPVSKNMTTNEYINGARYAYMEVDEAHGGELRSKFDQGFTKNVTEFWRNPENVDYKNLFPVDETFSVFGSFNNDGKILRLYEPNASLNKNTFNIQSSHQNDKILRLSSPSSSNSSSLNDSSSLNSSSSSSLNSSSPSNSVSNSSSMNSSLASNSSASSPSAFDERHHHHHHHHQHHHHLHQQFAGMESDEESGSRLDSASNSSNSVNVLFNKV
eukprot:TRINITY_DN1139_c0_g1_i1.p1 TRINITY_DN1139_c0_g1~~TRINITY_DN1139_c0_g1_i1.p1  ORF type:complete len:249 (-),score=66.17 TRINITY_DN1139_c0_g1_i1:24-770(-)